MFNLMKIYTLLDCKLAKRTWLSGLLKYMSFILCTYPRWLKTDSEHIFHLLPLLVLLYHLWIFLFFIARHSWIDNGSYIHIMSTERLMKL